MSSDLSEESLDNMIEMIRRGRNEKGDMPIRVAPNSAVFTDADMELIKKISGRANINILDYIETMLGTNCTIACSPEWCSILNEMEKERN